MKLDSQKLDWHGDAIAILYSFDWWNNFVCESRVEN